MESVGAKLKKLRLEKGITLDEVYKKTRIHPDILKAIEEESFINLSPVYIKGFLKIYCKFLGIDLRDYIADSKGPEAKVKFVSDTKEKPVSLLKTAWLRLICFKFTYIKKIIFIFILILIFIIALFNLGRIISIKRSAVSKKNKLSTVTATNAANVAQTSAIIRLAIRAREDCWIQLKTDGRVVFRRILKKGRFESWQAKDKMELSLGNAGVVDLEVNGKLISKLGRRGQVLRDILITKEGINIKR